MALYIMVIPLSLLLITSYSESLNKKRKNQNKDVKNTVKAKGIAVLHITNMVFNAAHLENKHNNPLILLFR